jgi:DNA-binding protein YbaB
MSNLVKVVQQLRTERNQAQKRIEQLDEALKALTGGARRGGGIGHFRVSGKRKPMSVAARRRIAAAQRARWAKWKAAKKA